MRLLRHIKKAIDIPDITVYSAGNIVYGDWIPTADLGGYNADVIVWASRAQCDHAVTDEPTLSIQQTFNPSEELVTTAGTAGTDHTGPPAGTGTCVISLYKDGAFLNSQDITNSTNKTMYMGHVKNGLPLSASVRPPLPFFADFIRPYVDLNDGPDVVGMVGYVFVDIILLSSA